MKVGTPALAELQRSAMAFDDAVHDLAQPLTALAFLTEVALLQPEPAEWLKCMEAAARETKRAMEHLRQLRDAAARLSELSGVARESRGEHGVEVDAADGIVPQPAGATQAEHAVRRAG